MGSISSRPVSEALDDITRNLRPQTYQDYKEAIGDDSLVGDDSGCHLDDPRSPSSGISRTPIQPGGKMAVFRERAENVMMLFDPRSPGVPRTPIYAKDEDEDQAPFGGSDNFHPSLLESEPIFPSPTDTSTPLKTPSLDTSLSTRNRSVSLDRSLSDPNLNLSLDTHDEHLLIRSDSSPITQTRAVTKIRRSMKRAKNSFIRKSKDAARDENRGGEEPSPKTTPRLGGLKIGDINSPRAFVQRKASMRISDGLNLKRRHSLSSPYKIESLDKENLPYS